MSPDGEWVLVLMVVPQGEWGCSCVFVGSHTFRLS
jgi:hypothetical protein